jgi:hypothetical protein
MEEQMSRDREDPAFTGAVKRNLSERFGTTNGKWTVEQKQRGNITPDYLEILYCGTRAARVGWNGGQRTCSLVNDLGEDDRHVVQSAADVLALVESLIKKHDP